MCFALHVRCSGSWPMLKLAETADLINDFCTRDAFGTKIAGYFASFGGDSRFAQFWVQQDGDGSPTAAICKSCGSVVLSADGSADFEELLQFVGMIGFSTLSCSLNVCASLGLVPSRSGNIVCYRKAPGELKNTAEMPRYPDLREIYSLLVRSGFDRLGDRDDWIADVSLRMNRGAAQWSVISVNGETAACACALFVTQSAAFLGCVAADEKLRGRGLGSAAVLTLAEKYRSEGKRVELFCRDGEIVDFYKKTGFEPVGRWAEYDAEQE